MRLPFLPTMLLLAATVARAEPPPVQVWIAPGDPAVAAAARRGLDHALRSHGRSAQEIQTPAAAEPSLQRDLEVARKLYGELKLDDALGLLEQLATAAQRLGGGDLDTAGLAELYVTLGLCALELNRPDAAWDAFVRAVRIDPTRALDPARIPPRATASHRRAQLELGQQQPVELTLRLPLGARARIDGDEGHGAGRLARRLVPGSHFVRVDAPGYKPFRGLVTWTLPSETFAPDLKPLEAPLDEGTDGVSARLERVPEGWRLALRGRSAGLSLEAGSLVVPEDADAVAMRLADRVLGPVPRRVPVWKRWWVWTLAGAAVAAVAIAVPVALTTRGGTIPGSAGGTLEPVR